MSGCAPSGCGAYTALNAPAVLGLPVDATTGGRCWSPAASAPTARKRSSIFVWRGAEAPRMAAPRRRPHRRWPERRARVDGGAGLLAAANRLSGGRGAPLLCLQDPQCPGRGRLPTSRPSRPICTPSSTPLPCRRHARQSAASPTGRRPIIRSPPCATISLNCLPLGAKTPAPGKAARTTNAIERRFREVRLRPGQSASSPTAPQWTAFSLQSSTTKNSTRASAPPFPADTNLLTSPVEGRSATI